MKRPCFQDSFVPRARSNWQPVLRHSSSSWLQVWSRALLIPDLYLFSFSNSRLCSSSHRTLQSTSSTFLFFLVFRSSLFLNAAIICLWCLHQSPLLFFSAVNSLLKPSRSHQKDPVAYLFPLNIVAQKVSSHISILRASMTPPSKLPP